ncbi:MAG: signal peptidase I [Planctomycetota bacterium]|jgi:signal peptidase I|nr:signal peptidase I [Planctomycetota bacterium]
MARQKNRANPSRPHSPPSDPAKPSGPGKPSRPAWRSGIDLAVMLGGAVLVALAIKAYVFDVYLIPSGSMETTLHGRPDGGDRIFCSKLHYLFRPPRRWETAVFEFPYEQALQSEPADAISQYNGQNFVKRVIGLPGETLAIFRGDIWTRPAGSRADFVRQAKPDAIQRGVWQKVWDGEFSDLSRSELERFWRVSGGEAGIEKDGTLLLSPGPGGVRLDYRPLVPARSGTGEMEELFGIPDRYVLEQPVQFRCRGRTPDGEPCGRLFVKTVQSQAMPARCPVCGYLNDESAAVFYHRRSGLYHGFAAAGSRVVPQGEDSPSRRNDYFTVTDLRFVADLVLEKETSVFAMIFREDDREVCARFYGDGRVEIRLDGRLSETEARTLAPVRPGAVHRFEWYAADGLARIFVDSEENRLLELPLWKDRRSSPKNLPSRSGAAVSAEGGPVRIRRLSLDRDIFYYSGWEQNQGEKFRAMNSFGEVHIPADSFLPMGDHCPSSYDARSWGPVRLSLLRGPALLVWWPPERIGIIPNPSR